MPYAVSFVQRLRKKWDDAKCFPTEYADCFNKYGEWVCGSNFTFVENDKGFFTLIWATAIRALPLAAKLLVGYKDLGGLS